MPRLTLTRSIVGLLTAALVSTPALARPKLTQCDRTVNNCYARCDRVFERPPRIEACKRRCDNTYVACIVNSGTRA